MKITRNIFVWAFAFYYTLMITGSVGRAQGPSKTTKKQQHSQAIEDNSFLIEEAFNQEMGIVQHIFNGIYSWRPLKDFISSFTQEWPLFSDRHQISYTIPISFLNSNKVKGVGDIAVNYRYQLFTREQWAAVAPRVSLILPTGNRDHTLGFGVTGFQFNLPVSKRLSELFIVHFNAGFTVLPHVKGTDLSGNNFSRSLTSFNLGGSIIWLARKNYNFMLEYLNNFSSEIGETSRLTRSTQTTISPGFRFAIDVGSLQIVPGIAMPLSVDGGKYRPGVLFYLSFEHPFKRKGPS